MNPVTSLFQCSAMALILALPTLGQAELVGFTDAALVNSTGSGSARIAARIYYPAQRAGRDAPLKARSGGWPSLVFLHGLGGLGRFYTDLGAHFASRGYIAVQHDTGQFSSTTQARDAAALFAILRAETNSATSFFRGAFDMQRVAVGGHSMGGGNTIRTLAANIGYRAGIGWAPWDHGSQDYPSRYSAQVRVPLLILHGEGDTTVNWRSSGLRFWQLAANYTGAKVMYLTNRETSHSNLVFRRSTSLAVFERSMTVASSFLDTYLRDSSTAFDDVLGSAARAEPRLRTIYSEIETPPLWRRGSASIGGTSTFRLAGEPGPSALLAAARKSPTNSPFGVLELDLGSLVVVATGNVDPNGLLSVPVPIPNDPALVNASFPFQGIANTRTNSPRLGPAIPLTVTR